jgi:peptidoglycan hydrolase CwlO-like protein
MKRDFLKELGIEDKETINKILDENSADIGRAKGEVDDLKSQINQLQSQLDKKTTEFDTLKESTKTIMI